MSADDVVATLKCGHQGPVHPETCVVCAFELGQRVGRVERGILLSHEDAMEWMDKHLTRAVDADRVRRIDVVAQMAATLGADCAFHDRGVRRRIVVGAWELYGEVAAHHDAAVASGILPAPGLEPGVSA